MQTYPDSEEPEKTASEKLSCWHSSIVERSRRAFDEIMKFRRYVKKMYELFERLSADEFLRGTPGQLYKYELQMNECRAIQAILDSVPKSGVSDANSEAWEDALRAIHAIVDSSALRRRKADMSARMAIVERVRAQLPPEALKTSDGSYTFSTENILAVALVAPLVNDRNEFDAITGFYGGGYQSELRKCVYHGSNNSSKGWGREIHRLYHIIKKHVTDVTLPQLREQEDCVPADAWKVSEF